MKKTMILMLLLPLAIFGQKIGADVIKFDTITSSTRDSYTVPNDEVWWIYNESTGQFEVNVKNTGWVAFSSGDPDQTLAEVLTQGNDAGGLGINNLGIVNVTDLSASNSISGDGSAITSISSSNVNIEDGGSYYSSTVLEGALQEQGPRLLPIGGTAGQVLEKIDGTDYNVQWATPSGGDPDQTLSISGSEGQNINISGSGGNSIDITESVNDIVANMVIGNTETGIDVTYDDVGGKLNFDVTAGGTPPAPTTVEMTDGVAPTTAQISNPTNGTVNIINSTASDKTIPLDNLNVGTINDSFFIGDRNTAGVTRVQEGTMTFADTPDKDGDSKGSNNAIEITDNAYVFFNEDIDGNPLPEGNFDWVTISSCTPDPNELFTTANAASDPNCNEANGTSGITNDAGTLTVSTSEVNVGTYALQHVAGAANGHRFRISFNVTNGNTYTLSWDEYQSIGTEGIVHTVSGAGNVTGEPSFRDIATGGWTSDSVVMTATATGTVEIAFYSANGGASGDTIHIDNISIIEN